MQTRATIPAITYTESACFHSNTSSFTVYINIFFYEKKKIENALHQYYIGGYSSKRNPLLTFKFDSFPRRIPEFLFHIDTGNKVIFNVHYLSPVLIPIITTSPHVGVTLYRISAATGLNISQVKKQTKQPSRNLQTAIKWFQ